MSPKAIRDSGGHVESEDCWCGPKILRQCRQCDGEGCWQCEEGWIEGREYDDEMPCVIVHTDDRLD